ncbi:MAG: hypothetical protein ACRYHQ_01835 [Janthinobacterium lividum]
MTRITSDHSSPMELQPISARPHDEHSDGASSFAALLPHAHIPGGASGADSGLQHQQAAGLFGGATPVPLAVHIDPVGASGPHAHSAAEHHDPHLFDLDGGTAHIDPHQGGAGLDDADSEDLSMAAGHNPAGDEAPTKPPVSLSSAYGTLGTLGAGYASLGAAHQSLAMAGGQAAGSMLALAQNYVTGGEVKPHDLLSAAATTASTLGATAFSRTNGIGLAANTALSFVGGQAISGAINTYKDPINDFVGNLFHRQHTPESQSEV